MGFPLLPLDAEVILWGFRCHGYARNAIKRGSLLCKLASAVAAEGGMPKLSPSLSQARAIKINNPPARHKGDTQKRPPHRACIAATRDAAGDSSNVFCVRGEQIKSYNTREPYLTSLIVFRDHYCPRCLFFLLALHDLLPRCSLLLAN